MDSDSGEFQEQRLAHREEAEKFYRNPAAQGVKVRVGMEATGYAQWFERMLAKLGHELWVGDAAEIRAAMVRKQKTDSRDALHILDLLVQKRFPRIWVPSPAERDLRQLLRHRHKMVCLRTSLRKQRQALAMGQGIYRKMKLWARAGREELERIALDPWAERRRQELLEILDRLDPSLAADERSTELPRCLVPNGATWRRAGYGVDARADHRSSRALPDEQTGSELSRTEST
jgi:transposase